ncbi:unnamed protein product, partial [Closterium sp. NIES-53]
TEPRRPAEPCRPAKPRRPTEPRRLTEPRRTAEPRCPSACTPSAATTATATTAATAATAANAAMASPTVLTFDAEGRAVDFDEWVDDLQLFLQCDSRDGVSMFDHTSGVSTAPTATADSMVRSQWTTRDAVARLAVRSHMPSAERMHFGQYKTAKSLYDAVVARYSSPATAALSRLMLPYVFPNLAAFATVADLITHLCTSDARYALRFPLRSLTVDQLEERLTAAEMSILAAGASRGDRRTPFFEGCSIVPLLPSVASAAAVDLVGTEEVGAASAPSGRHRTSSAKGGKGGGGDGGGGGLRRWRRRRGWQWRWGWWREWRLRRRQRQRRWRQRLRWWRWRWRWCWSRWSSAARMLWSGGVGPCTYILRTGGRRGETCGLPHTAQRCFGRLTDAWHAQFPDAVELHCWGDLLRQNVAIFDLDLDAILAAMYAVTDSAEGDCYRGVPPDPGIEAAALGASASAAPGTGDSAAPGTGESALSGTALTEALHTFTLDSGASRSFFRDSTTLTPLSRPVAVSLALRAQSLRTLPRGADFQDAWVDQFTPGGQRVTHCTCSRTGRHLARFTCRPGSSLYTLTTASPSVAASGQVFSAASKSSPVSAPCSCRPQSHETLLWHHRLGHPSLPRLRGMASRTL